MVARQQAYEPATAVGFLHNTLVSLAASIPSELATLAVATAWETCLDLATAVAESSVGRVGGPADLTIDGLRTF